MANLMLCWLNFLLIEFLRADAFDLESGFDLVTYLSYLLSSHINRLAQRIVQGDVPQALMNRRVCK